MNRAQKAVQGAGGAPTGAPTTGGTTPLADIAPGITLSADAIALLAAMQTPEFWRRILYILIGVILVLMALVKMSATDQNVKLAKTALSLTPVGAAGKVGKIATAAKAVAK